MRSFRLSGLLVSNGHAQVDVLVPGVSIRIQMDAQHLLAGTSGVGRVDAYFYFTFATRRDRLHRVSQYCATRINSDISIGKRLLTGISYCEGVFRLWAVGT